MGSRPGRPGWIGVDLDKTSAVYDDFRGVTHIGAPIMPMIERMRYWLSKGIDVRIFTARANPASYEDPAKHQEVIKAVQAFTIEHLGVALPVTHEKDYDLEQIWDDRAIGVKPNTGIPLHDVNSAHRLEYTEALLRAMLSEPHPHTDPYRAAHVYLYGTNPDWA